MTGTGGGRLVTGTRILTAQFGEWLACRDLETEQRQPLRGAALVKASLGRAAGAFVVAWFVGGILYATGLILWGTLALWALAALVASSGQEEPEDAPAEPEAVPAMGPDPREREQLLAALDDATAGRSGIHLWLLWEQLRAWPRYAEMEDQELRALLAAHGIPVQKITADRVRGRSGVKRADIEALLTPSPPPPLPAAPLGEEDRADLRKSSSSSGSGEGPEEVTCTSHELGDDTFAMLRQEVSDR